MTQTVGPELSIVVPVYGRFDLLDSCLSALEARTEMRYEILVVDDATPDESLVVGLDNCRVLRRGTNGGFAAASNTGIARSVGRLVAIVNSDTEVMPGWDIALRSALDSGAALAAACQLDENGSVLEAGTVVGSDGHVALGEVGSDIADVRAIAVVPAVGAACMMARRADLIRWGGFSRSYGRGYYEDVDLSLLLSRLGRRCVVVASARVEHTRHGSFDRAEVEQRLRAGRAVLGSRRRWELRSRPSVHGWELSPARRSYAWSHGCAGRAMLVGAASDFESLVELLDRHDIADHVVSPNPEGATTIEELRHWADVVIGSERDLEPVSAAIRQHQPRAVFVDAQLDERDILEVCAENGLGRQRLRPGARDGDNVSVGLSRCRSAVASRGHEIEVTHDI